MKFILLFLVMSSQAFCAILPEEKTGAIEAAREVMMNLAGKNTEAKLVSTSVVDEIGTRLIVEFAYKVDINGYRKCSYSYDRVLGKALKDTVACNL